MTYIAALIIFAVIVVLIFSILFVPGWISKESPEHAAQFSSVTRGDKMQFYPVPKRKVLGGNSPHESLPKTKEHYGPPPGVQRAVSHEELDDRGWPEFPYEYTANTASSISHMIERSA